MEGGAQWKTTTDGRGEKREKTRKGEDPKGRRPKRERTRKGRVLLTASWARCQPAHIVLWLPVGLGFAFFDGAIRFLQTWAFVGVDT